MLSCREVAELADGLIDGDLTAMQALQMRLHVAMCKGCNRFIGQMRVTRDLADAVVADPGTVSEADDRRISAIFAQLHAEQKNGG
ncbi:MAG: zf-HC2 domain-containing protein [Paracoccaceae bacterium]|nr:zf-HC2 domain-containing protein [Paracoccaceae bacterium]